jgi:hypothetical protein
MLLEIEKTAKKGHDSFIEDYSLTLVIPNIIVEKDYSCIEKVSSQ